MSPSRPSVIIIAHGSSRSDGAQEAAMEHALTLRQSNRYGTVDFFFLARDQAIPDLPSGEIFLLPFFMSNGYFVTRRIPELFNLTDGRRIGGGRRLFQCEALGTDPELAGILSAMVRDICRENSYRMADVHVVLVAHGSEKSCASADAAYLQQRAVEARGEFGDVSVAFLSQSPFLDEWLAAISENGPPLVLVGLFAAEGPHAAEDVPGAIENWRKKLASARAVHYAGAVGARPEIVRLIQQSISRRAAAEG